MFVTNHRLLKITVIIVIVYVAIFVVAVALDSLHLFEAKYGRGTSVFAGTIKLISIYYPIRAFLAMGLSGVADGGVCPLIWNPCTVTPLGWGVLLVFWSGITLVVASIMERLTSLFRRRLTRLD
jgi:steroid 5-alpha reductase family enzyme